MRLDGTILVVAPHPDDEVLGCGWLMRRAVAAGGQAVVTWLTDGGASHGDLPAGQRAALIATRQAEAQGGLVALGVDPAATHFLGFPDGSLANFEAPARARLQTIVDDAGVDTVFVTSADDGHADHRAAFAIASGLTGVALYAYPVSARYDGAVTGGIQAFVADEWVAAKRAALACHISQTAAGGARYPLSAAVIDRFCTAPETFVAVRR